VLATKEYWSVPLARLRHEHERRQHDLSITGRGGDKRWRGNFYRRGSVRTARWLKRIWRVGGRVFRSVCCFDVVLCFPSFWWYRSWLCPRFYSFKFLIACGGLESLLGGVNTSGNITDSLRTCSVGSWVNSSTLSCVKDLGSLSENTFRRLRILSFSAGLLVSFFCLREDSLNDLPN